jgi:hypothetical protein
MQRVGTQLERKPMTKQSSTSARSTTNEGTDRPWERSGQAAQNRHMKLADSKTREREYESSIGSVDPAPYQQASSPTTSGLPPQQSPSNIVDEEGQVGDPLPIALLVIVAVPILLMIAALVWWMVR